MTLFGGLNFQTGAIQDLANANSIVYSFGPGIRVRLFDGGRIESNLRVRESQAKQARLALEATLRAAIGEVESASSGLRYGIERARSLDLAAEAARDGVVLARELYDAGLSDLLQVVDAQREQVALEGNRLTAEQDALSAAVQLFRALGGGWQVLDLGWPTAILPLVTEASKNVQRSLSGSECWVG